MTPHLEAAQGDYAAVALLPGDPQRAEWIAENFLDGARCVNRIRGALGYTGTWQGHPISVQTTGMGAGSVAIYAHELMREYGVQALLRVGSCGSLGAQIRLRDAVISEAVIADHAPDGVFGGNRAQPAAGLLSAARQVSSQLPPSDRTLHFGLTASSDAFYHPSGQARLERLRELQALAIDMETFELYALAARYGRYALSFCTVVDSVVTFEAISRSERQEVFRPIVELALATAAAWSTSSATK